MYTVALKDPVYGLPVWQAEVHGVTAFADRVKQAQSAVGVWQVMEPEGRKQLIQQWRQQCRKALPAIGKTASQAIGLPIAQLQQDLNHWLDVTPSEPGCGQAGVVALLADTVDFQFLEGMLEHLLAGQAVVLLLPGFLAALLQQLLQHWPEDASADILQLLVVDDWHDLDFQGLTLAGVYFWGSDAGARAVHAKLAGQFDLPSTFNTLRYNTVVLTGEVTEVQIDKLVQAAFQYSGQGLRNIKRILVTADIAGRVKKQLQIATKQLRVAAFDAQPEPFISSLPSLQHAKAAMTYYQHLTENGLAELVPMRRLLGNAGMLTPGIVECASEQVNRFDTIVPAPLLQLVVVSDLLQAAAVIKHTKPLGTVQVATHNNVALHKLKLLCHGVALSEFK